MSFPSQASFVAEAHHVALAMLSKASGAPLQGPSQGARRLQLGSPWTRKLRAFGDALAICRHITEQKNEVFLAELAAALLMNRRGKNSAQASSDEFGSATAGTGEVLYTTSGDLHDSSSGECGSDADDIIR